MPPEDALDSEERDTDSDVEDGSPMGVVSAE